LPFGLHVAFRDEIDDGAIFGEDFFEGGFEGVGLDGFFEVADVDAKMVSISIRGFTTTLSNLR
jgi:hypothetical protein